MPMERSTWLCLFFNVFFSDSVYRARVRVFSVFLALLGNQADLGELIGDGLLIFNLESTCVGSRVVRRIFSKLHRTNPKNNPNVREKGRDEDKRVEKVHGKH